MAGWHADNADTQRPALRLRALRRTAPTTARHKPEVEPHLPAERISLVAAFVGAYPEDAAERTQCKRLLHQPREQRVEAATG